MSLKINFSWKRVVPVIIWSVLGILFTIFLVKVFVWEHNYYNEKEGSERAVTTNTVEEEVEVDETVPTEEEIVEYQVAADRPRYLTIEKLGVYNSRVIEVGLTASGALGTPNNIFDTGWYNKSGKPGQGGTMLLDGHSGGPHVHGIFKELSSLENGDIVTIERGDGVKFKYEIVKNVTISLDEADSFMNSARKAPEGYEGQESLTIISCTGEWSTQRQTYLSRQFAFAVLVEE